MIQWLRLEGIIGVVTLGALLSLFRTVWLELNVCCVKKSVSTLLSATVMFTTNTVTETPEV